MLELAPPGVGGGERDCVVGLGRRKQQDTQQLFILLHCSLDQLMTQLFDLFLERLGHRSFRPGLALRRFVEYQFDAANQIDDPGEQLAFA